MPGVIVVIFPLLRCHSKGLFYTDDTPDPFKINFLVNQSFTTCGCVERTTHNKVYEWQCSCTATFKSTKHTTFFFFLIKCWQQCSYRKIQWLHKQFTLKMAGTKRRESSSHTDAGEINHKWEGIAQENKKLTDCGNLSWRHRRDRMSYRYLLYPAWNLR